MPATESRPCILLVSHCILNQNAVVQPLARSSGVLFDAASWALEQGWGIYQLPCPEFRARGPLRDRDTFDGYNTEDFHRSNREILDPVIRQLRRYQDAGYRIVGGMHVQGSPSCDPDTGNWITDILAAAEAAGIVIETHWQVPKTADAAFRPDDPATVFGDPRSRRVYPDGAATPTAAQRASADHRRAVFLAGDRIPVRPGLS
ncbi:hypothetical protein [Microbacterium candidum]|uniref:DUF523 domain-containing protein n=1 Tax=Microbacterium candidum TaxID=3041922 RepID=A0ABT7MVE2_9MICO|nr:hypothetical protein [Microbacterium sp. ASV49]MDL9978419.1 hypothetical protein [Microbacterium sp. ASV49]